MTRIGYAVAALLLACALRANAQDPLKTLAKNYHLVFENGSVAVIRAHYGPHETVPVHDHPSVATVFVYLNDSGPVRIKHQEGGAHQEAAGAPETVVRPPTVAGSYRVAPGLAERHSIENPGDTPSDFLRVELKGVTLGIKEPFRGRAPAGPLTDEDVVEFSDPAVRVERIVCVEAGPCGVKAEAEGSLLVALGPVVNVVSAGGGANMNEDQADSVWWVPAGRTSAVTSKSGALQLLRIVLPGAVK